MPFTFGKSFENDSTSFRPSYKNDVLVVVQKVLCFDFYQHVFKKSLEIFELSRMDHFSTASFFLTILSSFVGGESFAL